MSDRRPPSLRDQVAGDLHAAMRTGSLRPGVTYTVRTVAARFGASSTPCCEAIFDRCGEGVRGIKLNRGFTAVEPDAATVVHMANVRRLLEIPTTLEVVRCAGPATSPH